MDIINIETKPKTTSMIIHVFLSCEALSFVITWVSGGSPSLWALGDLYKVAMDSYPQFEWSHQPNERGILCCHVHLPAESRGWTTCSIWERSSKTSQFPSDPKEVTLDIFGHYFLKTLSHNIPNKKSPPAGDNSCHRDASPSPAQAMWAALPSRWHPNPGRESWRCQSPN